MTIAESLLADRVRKALHRRRGLSERKMFGGIAFLLNGHMCCGVLRDLLVLRLGPEAAERALREPNTRPMDFTGRPIKSMIYVEPDGTADDDDLRAWVRRAVDYAKTLPPK